MAMRDIQSMLNELDTLLKSNKGLNRSAKEAIDNFLLIAEYSVRASLITDVIDKNEPEIEKVREWISSEITKTEEEKKKLEEEKEGAILSKDIENPELKKLEIRLRELREISAGIDLPEKLAERMTREYKQPWQRENLVDKMGEYLCVGYATPRSFKGQVLAPRVKGKSVFSGYSLNVDALKELISVVRDENLVNQAGEIVQAEEQVASDAKALKNLDSALTVLPNESKILECAFKQRTYNDAKNHYNAASKSLTNFKGNALVRFFSSRWGKLKQANDEIAAYESMMRDTGEGVKTLLDELVGAGLNVDANSIIGISDALPGLKNDIGNAFNINMYGKDPAEAIKLVEQCKAKKEVEIEEHKKALDEKKKGADEKISGLSKDDLETVLDCAGKGKFQPKQIGDRRDPRFALFMFELLVRENEITPDMMLKHGEKGKEVVEEERNELKESIEQKLDKMLNEIKEKVNGITEDKDKDEGEIE